MRVALVLFSLCVGACGGAPAKPGCEDGDLARINASEQGELAYYCLGQGVDCPAREEIHARYKKSRQDWFLRCQQ